MEQIKEFIIRSNLNEDQLISIIQFCNKKVLKILEICDECGFIGTNLIQNCDGSDNSKESLCGECATYCSDCQIYYSQVTKHKHENCSESENREAGYCEYCGYKFTFDNSKEHYSKCKGQPITIDTIFSSNDNIHYFQGNYAYHTIDFYSIIPIKKIDIENNDDFKISYNVNECKQPENKKGGLTLSHIFEIQKMFKNMNITYTKVENGFIDECYFRYNNYFLPNERFTFEEKDKYKLLSTVFIKNRLYGVIAENLSDVEENKKRNPEDYYETIEFLIVDNAKELEVKEFKLPKNMLNIIIYSFQEMVSLY
jgi:hypothetical protein